MAAVATEAETTAVALPVVVMLVEAAWGAAVRVAAGWAGAKEEAVMALALWVEMGGGKAEARMAVEGAKVQGGLGAAVEAVGTRGTVGAGWGEQGVVVGLAVEVGLAVAARARAGLAVGVGGGRAPE